MPKGLKGFQKGHKSGMTGKLHLEKSKKKMSEAKKGKKLSEEHKRKISENHHNRGKHLLETTRMKIGESHKGKSHPQTEETKQKIREWAIIHPNRKFKDTSIELKVEAELQRRNINYQKQVPLCKIAIVDFYLPEYRIVIQCDGHYWHNKEGARDRDEAQDRVLTFNGFNVYRFIEDDINKSVEECVNRIENL